jgi:hypothetical protein
MERCVMHLSNRLFLIGFLCVLTGAVLPFLMVMRILPSTFFLNFVAFSTSVIGIFLGVIGVAMHTGMRKQRERNEYSEYTDYYER